MSNNRSRRLYEWFITITAGLLMVMVIMLMIGFVMSGCLVGAC